MLAKNGPQGPFFLLWNLHQNSTQAARHRHKLLMDRRQKSSDAAGQIPHEK